MILYIKSVPTEMDISLFNDLLNERKISFRNLERVKTGKDRSNSFTLRLLVHDKGQKIKLIREGLLLDHKLFKLEPHVKITVKQCFKCLGYGHLVADCTNEQCCTRCGGPHRHKDCPVDRESATCANCSKDDKVSAENRNHAALDKACPTRIRLLREARRLDLKKPNTVPYAFSGASTQVPDQNSRKDFPFLSNPAVASSLTTASGSAGIQIGNFPPNRAFLSGGISHPDGGFQAKSGLQPNGWVQPNQAGNNEFIFGERIVDPASLDENRNSWDISSIVATVLGVVSSALGEIFQGSTDPKLSPMGISNSILRSVGRLNHKDIDLAMVARSLMTKTSVGLITVDDAAGNGQRRPVQSTVNLQQQTTDWISALSSQVTDNALRKPPPMATHSRVVNPQKPKRTYTRKNTPQAHQQRQRTVSETGSESSLISISSGIALGIHSTPAGQRLASTLGASPIFGRESAPVSPTLSCNLSSGGSHYKTPLSGEESVRVAMDAEDTTLNPSSTLGTSLTNILLASAQQSAKPNMTSTTLSAEQIVAAATQASKPASQNRKKKAKNQMLDSKSKG